MSGRSSRSTLIATNRSFTVHHMAPMAPHCANVEQDRLVLPLGLLERFLTPLMPANGLVHGRAQVRGRSVREGVQGIDAHNSSLYGYRNGARTGRGLDSF